MAIDRAKNTLKAAKVLKKLSASTQLLSDAVGRSDPDDLYRVRLTNRSTLDLNLTGAKAKIQLFALKGVANKALKAIGRIPFSDLSRKQRQKFITVVASGSTGKRIQRTVEPGTYYIRVSRNQGESRYQLKYLAASSSTSSNSGKGSPFPSPTWLRQFGTGENDYSFGMAVDASGALYVTGVTTPSNITSGTGFVAKYNKDGSEAWRRSIQISGSTAVSDIAVDSAGNYYIVGAKVDGLNSDAFVAKYDSAGQQQWLKTI